MVVITQAQTSLSFHIPSIQFASMNIDAILAETRPTRKRHQRGAVPFSWCEMERNRQTTTHWIFTAWPDHFFAFLAALDAWSWRAKKN
jgi:hypothetical protein